MKIVVGIVVLVLIGAVAFLGIENAKVTKQFAEHKDAAKVMEAGLTEAADMAVAETAKMKDELEARKAEKMEMVTKLEAANAETTRLKADRERIQTAADAAKKEADELKAVKTALEANVAELKTAQDALQKELETAKEAAAAADKAKTDLSDEITAAKTEAAQAMAEKNAMQKEFALVGARRAVWRGTVLLEQERAEEAAAEFRTALDAVENMPEALKGLALCFEAVGSKAEAMKMWQAYVATGPSQEDLAIANEHIDGLGE